MDVVTDNEAVGANIATLAGGNPLLALEQVHAGYGTTRILHGVDLQLAAGQSLCLIGPNGAGKSTVLNAIYGFASLHDGRILFEGHDIAPLNPRERLQQLGIAYLLQGNSVFPDMSVQLNMELGGYLMNRRQTRQAIERIFDTYPRLAQRKDAPARALSGGERRLLEIARALMMKPRLLLVDEPSIGLEPRHIETVFDALHECRHKQGLAILMVEQNIRKGLTFADIGYELAAGKVITAAPAAVLLSRVGMSWPAQHRAHPPVPAV